MSKTIVVFRMQGRTPIAVFPNAPSQTLPNALTAFAREDGLFSLIQGYYEITRPAKPDEYAGLKRELESAPYHYDLDVRQRIPRGSYEVRRAALGAP